MVPLAVSDHFVDINEMVDEVRLAILHPRSSIFVSNPPSPVTCHVSPQRSAFLTHSLDRRKIAAMPNGLDAVSRVVKLYAARVNELVAVFYMPATTLTP